MAIPNWILKYRRKRYAKKLRTPISDEAFFELMNDKATLEDNDDNMEWKDEW